MTPLSANVSEMDQHLVAGAVFSSNVDCDKNEDLPWQTVDGGLKIILYLEVHGSDRRSSPFGGTDLCFLSDIKKRDDHAGVILTNLHGCKPEAGVSRRFVDLLRGFNKTTYVAVASES